MKVFVSLCALLLVACSVPSERHPKSETFTIYGAVEALCAGCDIADLVGGGALEWDVLRVHITQPEPYAGTVISVEVLIEGDGSTQRLTYSPGSSLQFTANMAALEAQRVLLHASDVHGG
jgi:hypothetical protein